MRDFRPLCSHTQRAGDRDAQADRNQTARERQQLPPAGCQTQLLLEQSHGGGFEVSFPAPLTSAQKTLRLPTHTTRWERWVLPALLLQSPPPPLSQSWAGLALKNSRAGRDSLSGRQTWCRELPQERPKDFILIPKLLAWKGSHKSERDFAVFSDVSFLLLIDNFRSQTFPFPLRFLEVGRHEKGLGVSAMEDRHHWFGLAWTTYGCAHNFQIDWGPHCYSSLRNSKKIYS